MIKHPRELIEEKKKLQHKNPLIHCTTNPISINDCANAVLAVGGKPIMAEHPGEVREITKVSSALALNLGNITDVRMESMRIAALTAKEYHIPICIDLVGIACSSLRLTYAKELVTKVCPTVIKGNVSEIKAIANLHTDHIGIDVGQSDVINEANFKEHKSWLRELSYRLNAVIVATGEVDVIVWKEEYYFVHNGVAMLSKVTGTGCMLNVLIATFLSCMEPVNAAVYATALLGIAGEVADGSQGTGTFRVSLMDQLSVMSDELILERAHIIAGDNWL